MRKHALAIGAIIILNACIWGGVILMSSYQLKGTGTYSKIQNTLAGGAAASIIVGGGGFATALTGKKREEE